MPSIADEVLAELNSSLLRISGSRKYGICFSQGFLFAHRYRLDELRDYRPETLELLQAQAPGARTEPRPLTAREQTVARSKSRFVLRDDSLSYRDYIEQLTFLLFLKMANEQTWSPFSRN